MKQSLALEILKTGANVFITGPAGSGKTHVINQYISYLKVHGVDVGITASTGIAATHIGGVTIHSWSGIGVNSYLSDSDIEGLAEKSYLKKRFDRVKVLIIDEISMLHDFRFDLVDKVLRTMKNNPAPFGGVQVVLCGDFFQLPPVTRFGEPESDFVFNSKAWREGNFLVCYLEEQFRQSDDAMISILNEIRTGIVSENTRLCIEDRHMAKIDCSVEPTRLFTHNIDVDTVNMKELKALKSNEYAIYEMESRGPDALVAAIKKSCLAPEKLELKAGARVMCVKNNFEEGYVNGTLGIVVSCKQGANPVVRFANGITATLEKASWKIEEDNHVKAEILQYPIRLAWAITVHKSQGMSLDAVEVDLSKAFESGMGYVALSRVRTLNGLRILDFHDNAYSINQDVLNFDDELRAMSEENAKKFSSIRDGVLEEQQKEFLDNVVPAEKIKKLSPHQETALLIDKRMSLADMAKLRNVTKETIVTHIEKLQAEGEYPDIAYLRKEVSQSHYNKVKKAINDYVNKAYEKGEDINEIHLSPIKKVVGANISFLTIRLMRVLLGYAPKSGN